MKYTSEETNTKINNINTNENNVETNDKNKIDETNKNNINRNDNLENICSNRITKEKKEDKKDLKNFNGIQNKEKIKIGCF